MILKPFRKFLLTVIIVVLPYFVKAQFYNGMQMTFGKNRVQYNGFYWTYFRFDKFDTYYSENGRELAEHTANYAEGELTRLQNLFDYNLDKRVIFVIYNKLSDFRQSNIGLVTGKTDNNIGGVVKMDKNKVFLYFEGDYRKFNQQISAAIAEVLINEIIYGTDYKSNVTSTTLINLPAWYVQGLVAYVSNDWDIPTENRVRDGILYGNYDKFNRLVGEDAKYAGHSFWRYIADTYGESIIPSILYLTKINKNANSGFLYVIGSTIKDLSKEWSQFYYDGFISFTGTDDINSTGEIVKKPKKKAVYQQLKINPNGKYLAYTTNQMGKYKIFIKNLETGKTKRILRRENKLDQITDYSYPVMAWHPSGRILTFITEQEGGLKLNYFTFGEKEIIQRNILYFEKVLDYSFSKDGTLLALSAIKNSHTDIYIHNISAGTNFQVTNDKADDFNPKFINGDKSIIFSSDRISDSLSSQTAKDKISQTTDLFIYDYANHADQLMRLTDGMHINKTQPIELSQNNFLSLSDRNGLINRYHSKFDSAVSFVDTTIHFRYLAHTKPLTNYPTDILEYDYNSKAGTLSEITFLKGKYNMTNRTFNEMEKEDLTLPITAFRKTLTTQLAEKDSLNAIEIIKIPIDSVINNKLVLNEDTIHFENPAIDINNYLFEIEKINLYNSKLNEENRNAKVVEKLDEENVKPRIYQKTFYQNYIVSQVDFSFLSESYQAFTAGAVYFNPGINLLLKIGTNDLFEDYKITGGFRLPLDFESSEYLLSFENLKKRLDKQLVFHRQAYHNFTGAYYSLYTKTVSTELSYITRYPFSQVSAISTTAGLRTDKNIYLTDLYSSTWPSVLEKPNSYKYWARFKAEYIFDNTRYLGINLYGGWRFKLFGEYYQQMNGPLDNLIVIGADFRNYLVIHRNLIWANRFATSASAGSTRLIYYLGGVDNWTNFSQTKTPTFIPFSEIRIDEQQNYAFQTVATNMRGFSQNIRNGNCFAVFNSELRWPIVRYFANYPMSNAFLENFQAIGFFDIGTAWSGQNPWSGQNAYDNDILKQGTVTVEIDAQREPVVAGYGFGVRSQLFGYFVRLDWAWGIENMQVLPRVFYFSLSLDF